MSDKEIGRVELEKLLNAESLETTDVKAYELQKWIEGVAEQNRQFDSEENVQAWLKTYTLKTAETNLKEEPVFIYIRSDQPYFIAKGTHQAAISLGSGLVAKASCTKGKPSIWAVMEYFPNILPFGYMNFEFIEETHRNLKLLFHKTSIVVPDIYLYRVAWNELQDHLVVSSQVYNASIRDLSRLFTGEIKQTKPFPNVYVTPDLRQEGRYSITEYDEESARHLLNGNDLIESFNSSFDLLMGRYSKGVAVGDLDPAKGPHFKPLPHGFDFTPETAIRKMFLLQIPIDHNDGGNLIIGDIDHVTCFK